MSGPNTSSVYAYAFTYDDPASVFTVTERAYVAAHPETGYGHIITGALVFDTDEASCLRVLLIQRSATDSMPNLWEVPGGSCDPTDKSVLHSVARELWEEAGLKAIRLSGPIGKPFSFRARSGLLVAKLVFLVDVERHGEGRLQPILNAKEHQHFVWASEEEIRSARTPDIVLSFTAKELQVTILQAFDLLKSTHT